MARGKPSSHPYSMSDLREEIEEKHKHEDKQNKMSKEWKNE